MEPAPGLSFPSVRLGSRTREEFPSPLSRPGPGRGKKHRLAHSRRPTLGARSPKLRSECNTGSEVGEVPRGEVQEGRGGALRFSWSTLTESRLTPKPPWGSRGSPGFPGLPSSVERDSHSRSLTCLRPPPPPQRRAQRHQSPHPASQDHAPSSL